MHFKNTDMLRYLYLQLEYFRNYANLKYNEMQKKLLEEYNKIEASKVITHTHKKQLESFKMVPLRW